MSHTLPALAYAYDALEPHIDALTMEIHHSRHHQTYITNLNAALVELPELAALPVDELLARFDSLPAKVQGAVRNHGGGHANHSLFWQVMSPQGGGEPGGELAEAIARDLGGLDAFKQAFTQAALSRFGSGWAWLVVDKAGRLQVVSSANQDSPLMEGAGAHSGAGRVGARLLPQVPEQASRLHSRVLQGDRLGRGGTPLPADAGLSLFLFSSLIKKRPAIRMN